jgi:pyroglutamyl-peptidase
MTDTHQVFHSHAANPSWLIAKSLSSELRSNKSKTVIKLHVRQTPLKVSYNYVREQLPPLLFPPSTSEGTRGDVKAERSTTRPSSGGDETEAAAAVSNQAGTRKVNPNFDLVLLMGMAKGMRHYKMETLGHRDGYHREDIDKMTLDNDTYWKDMGAPEVLHTGLISTDVSRRWKAQCTDDDVRPSDDAGRYLCDFALYTALSEYWVRDMSPPVTFLHVPGETTDEDLKAGKRVAEGLLRAMVDSERARGTL